jgi:hypothetical protein
MKLSRRDGAKLISSNFSTKDITISGLIKGTTISDLENNIDTLKRNVMVTNATLDMDYAGAYRRYIVDCSACTVSREHYNVTFVPFEVKFIASDPPFAKDITAIGGSEILNDIFSSENITSESVSDSFTVEGSAIPKAKVRYKFDAIGDISSIDFINLSTSKQINIATAFTSGDELLIDHDNLNVTLNGEPIEFEGVFPSLKLGSNSFESNMYLSSGTTLDSSQTVNNSLKLFYGNIRLAQSFQVTTSALIPKIQLLLRKVGNVSTNVSVRIETDSAGSPSGTAVSNGTSTILNSAIGTNAFWVQANLTDCELSSATTYWIVLSTTNGSPSDYFEWRSNNIGGYLSGNAARYFTSWSFISWDFCFKVYKNIVDVNNSTETAESITENFSATTYKDAGVTTADWNTSSGKLLLPFGSETTGNSKTNEDSQADFGKTTFSKVWQGINISTSSKITKIRIKLKKIGSPTDDIRIKVYGTTWDGYAYDINRSDLKGTCTANISGSTITTSFVAYDFSFSNIAVSSGDHIAFDIERTSSDNDSNYYSVSYYYNSNLSEFSTMQYYSGFPDILTVLSMYYIEYYKIYDTANNIGQSSALDTAASSIASATMTETATKPGGTSTALSLSSDGTNFVSVSSAVEKYFSTNINSSLKFKATLTGTTIATPEIDSLAVSYKLAGIISATTHRVSQSFIAGFTGGLGRIKLNVYKIGNPGSITVEIRPDSGGSPHASTVLATQTYTGSVLSDQFGWISINFASAASLTSTSTYWIVISAAGVDSSNMYMIRSRAGNVYANGTMKYSTNSGTGYTEFTNEDILFQTYSSSGLQHQFDMKIQYGKRYL